MDEEAVKNLRQSSTFKYPTKLARGKLQRQTAAEDLRKQRANKQEAQQARYKNERKEMWHYQHPRKAMGFDFA